MRGQPKTSTRSNVIISVDSNILEAIKQESEKTGNSVNSKINQILSKYTMFYRFIEETEPHVFLPPKFYLSIICLIGEKEFLKFLEKHSFEGIPSLFMNHNIEMTLDNFIKYFLQGPMIWGGAYSSFHYTKDDGHYTIVLEHIKNLKWSDLMGTGLCNLIKNLLKYDSTFEAFDNKTILHISTGQV